MGFMCNKTQSGPKAFIKLKGDLVQEHSQQQSANVSFISFSGRKTFHFHCGKGIRS